jgi:hypothetical protein
MATSLCCVLGCVLALLIARTLKQQTFTFCTMTSSSFDQASSDMTEVMVQYAVALVDENVPSLA